jgi:hypothetical protein
MWNIRRGLEHAVEKLTKHERKLTANERALKHIKRATKELAANETSQQGLEAALFMAMTSLNQTTRIQK